MKRILLIMTFALSLIAPAMAQQDDPKDAASRVQALKIAYLTKKLNLSPEEAQRFWPVYNKYEEEIRTANQEFRQRPGSELDREEKILNIRKRFNGEFTKALNAEKVSTFFRVEKEFNGMVAKEMMERRQNRQENRNRFRQQ